ncbi:MAG: hypothetical protein ACHQAX_03920 [Gammaproteobacteria bacterium]
MPYGNHDIAFTLGRTQPPHQAHFNMLISALISLKEHGKLIQFIGSSNIPLKFAKHEKNILSFEERENMITNGLIAELHERYEQDPMSIPPKFSARIQQGMPVLEPEEFVCIPLPDFSDPHRRLSEKEEKIREDAIAQVSQAGIPQHERFSKIMHQMMNQNPFMKHITIPPYSPSYLGWAINLRNVLDDIVEKYRNEFHVARPSVTYHCCGKDMGTLQYILLIATVIEFFEHQYDFKIAPMPTEMLNANISVNATDIRDAYVDVLSEYTTEKIQHFIEHPDALAQKYPVLGHMRPQARVAMLKAMVRLKDKKS